MKTKTDLGSAFETDSNTRDGRKTKFADSYLRNIT